MAQVAEMELESIDDMSLLDELEASEDKLIDAISEKSEDEQEESIVDEEVSKAAPLEETQEEDSDLFSELDSIEDGPSDVPNMAIKNDEDEDQDIPDFITEDLEQLENESYDDLEQIEIADDEPRKSPDFEVSENEKKRIQVQSDRHKKAKVKIVEDQNLLIELDQIRTKYINSLITRKKATVKNRYSRSQLLALEVQLVDILKSPKTKTYIKRNSRLINLETDLYEYNPKGMTVFAHAKVDNDNYRYIVNKKGEPKYKIFYSQITNISKISNLHRQPHLFRRIPKKIRYSVFDKKFDYSLRFNLHGGITKSSYTKGIIKDSSDYVSTIRAEIGYMTNFKLPVKLGFSAVYESMGGKLSNGGDFTSKSLSLGPTIVRRAVFGEYDFVLQPRFSLVSDLHERRSGDSKVHKLSDTSLLFGLEKYYSTKHFGKFIIGYNYQRKWLKGKAQNTGLNIGTHTGYDDSFSLSIGHRSDWIW